jgi:hypothetical protein
MANREGLDVGNVHRILGILMAFMFIGTGAYMHVEYDHLRNMEDAQRLLFRSVHIYLLLASLVNFALGIHYWVHPQTTYRLLQTIGSTLVGLSPVLFLLAFFNEPFLDGLQRPFSTPAIYAITAGLLLHLIAWYQARLNNLLQPKSMNDSE